VYMKDVRREIERDIRDTAPNNLSDVRLHRREYKSVTTAGLNLTEYSSSDGRLWIALSRTRY
jgi:hypothetical protein